MGWRLSVSIHEVTTKDLMKDRELSQASSQHNKRNQRTVLDPFLIVLV